jgi:lipopolysaccharide transport system permease protein
MQKSHGSPKELIVSAWRHRWLMFSLIKREVVGRYRGSMLGMLWSFFNPVFMLVVYTFVFSVVFKARWPGEDGSRVKFALVLFAGLLVFNLFSECIGKAPSLVLANVNYVKKVVFPLELLPWVSLGSALFHMLVSFGVWLLFYLFFLGLPDLHVLLFPLVLLPLIFFIMGASWFLAALGVFLRDIGQVVSLLITILLFLSPIFYPVAALPEKYQWWQQLSPLTLVIEQARDVLIYGRSPNMALYVANLTASGVVAALGFAWFQRMRKGFADVL